MGLIWFIIVGLVLILIAIFTWRRSYKFLQTAIHTQGKIIDTEIKTTTSFDDGGSYTTTYYHPVVEFTDKNNRLIKFTANIGKTGKRSWKIGKAVKVIYSPTDSDNAKLESFMQLWFLPLFLFLMGIFFLVIGILTY